MKKIDIHSHFLPRECFNTPENKSRKFRPSIIRDPSGKEFMYLDGIQINPDIEQLFDPERRIQDMKKAGYDMQALSPLPIFYYSADVETALSLCREENEAIAGMVKDHPDSFIGLASVPMQNTTMAVKELEYAVKKLGLSGVEINTNVDGKNLDEPEFLPFFAAAQEMDVPVFLHPHFIAGAERMKKYYMTNLVGNPLDTSIAIASIIYGGVLEKLPKLKLIFSHAGGNIPYIRGRIDHGYKVIPECHNAIPRPPSEYLKLMYFDSIAHYGAALNFMIGNQGIDRIVMGTDYPFSMGDLDPVNSINKIHLSKQDSEKIMWSNAAALFKLS
jgi:aminocarboxymuconate-semialdehyde decarboxylase